MTLPRSFALLLALAALAGCGNLPPLQPADAGRTCFTDSDCVPDGCCGMGTNAIHVQDRPDCSTVRCTGTCPVAQLRCGCALPVCRESRCSVAVTVSPSCP
jgi:hypothetical protein